MRTSISYHTRCNQDNNKKLVGGIFGGVLDRETVERLVSTHFTVVVKPTGTMIFVDKEGREVRLYLSVDPASTEKGAEALRAYNLERMLLAAAAENQVRLDRAELERAMEGLSHAEIMRRLSANA